MENNNENKSVWQERLEKVKEIASQINSKIKRIFPNFSTEIAIVVIVVALIGLSAGVISTATRTQSDELLNLNHGQQTTPTEDDSENTGPSFEINATEPVVTVQTIEYRPSQMCFIGDSRTVAMEQSVLTDAKFIAKSSMGLDWFNETAVPEFNNIKDDIEICVVLLGINDIRNADAYISRLNQFAEENTNKICVYVNLGPVDESKYTGIPNSSLEEFNTKLTNGLSDKWQIVDLYTYLSAEKFSSDDGLHYSMQDSAKIFIWVVESIKMQKVEIVN